MAITHYERREARHLQTLERAGFPCAGAGLRSLVSIAVLATEERLEEARLLFATAPTEMASWRMPEVWRRRFSAAGVTIPG